MSDSSNSSNKMNFVYLAKKYAGVDCLCDDRTYGGLLWPAAQGEKPKFETFLAWQGQEDQLGRASAAQNQQRQQERETAHRQAQVKALQDITPYEDQVRAEQAEIRDKTYQQRAEAVRLQHLLDTRTEVEHTWQEIGAAQHKVNEEAKQYLLDTAHHVAMSDAGVQPLPDEVASKRRAAMLRIKEGETVHANWQALRAKEMPTREDMIEAIRIGGDELERLKKICADVALKYPRPRKQNF